MERVKGLVENKEVPVVSRPMKSAAGFVAVAVMVSLAVVTAQEPAPKAASAAPKQAAAPSPGRMEQLLTAWEGQSAKLRTLKVSLYRIDKSPEWDEEDHYEGTAAFEKPQRAFLDFRKVQTKLEADPKAPKDARKKKVVPVLDPVTKAPVARSHETIVCTGEEVWHYRYDVKQVFVYSLDKDQRKRALEEGPLPFLFDMRADEAHRRYEMALQGETEKFFLVVIKPKLQDDKESFSRAWVFLEPKYLLPSRIVLFSPDGKSTKDFRVANIQANKVIEPRYFKGVAPGKPWTVERNPGAATGTKDTRKAAPARGDQTARRPAAENAPLPR